MFLPIQMPNPNEYSFNWKDDDILKTPRYLWPQLLEHLTNDITTASLYPLKSLVAMRDEMERIKMMERMFPDDGTEQGQQIRKVMRDRINILNAFIDIKPMIVAALKAHGVVLPTEIQKEIPREMFEEKKEGEEPKQIEDKKDE